MRKIHSSIKNLILIFLFVIANKIIFAQCCGGGSGSPIAGGSSQGVLQNRQFEINTNFQQVSTKKFFKEDKPDTNFLDKFSSSYLYFRLAYGLSKNLMLSLESGYFINKKEFGLNKKDTISSSGIGDLIIFPRYNIYNHSSATARWDVTCGLGYKIPLGKYNDSLMQIAWPNDTFFITKPLAVQPSSGANDFIFYLYALRGFPKHNFRIFANVIYIKKGWNPLGEKIGDYKSIGLFASKTVLKNVGITLQVKGEQIDSMRLNPNILLYAYPNYDPTATGSRKIFLSPQISYSYKNIALYVLSEFPIYQWVRKTQIASQFQTTIGISYRFFTSKNRECESPDSNFIYLCPMNCEGSGSNEPGKCTVCKMKLEKVK